MKVKTSKNTSLALDILDILGVKFIDHTPRLITHAVHLQKTLCFVSLLKAIEESFVNIVGAKSSLVLQSCLGQVYRVDEGDTKETTDSSIDDSG